MVGQLPSSLSDLQDEFMPTLQLALQQCMQRELQVALQQLRFQVQEDFKQEFDGFRFELEHAQQVWSSQSQQQPRPQSVTQREAGRRGGRSDSATDAARRLCLARHAKSFLVQTALNAGDDDEDEFGTPRSRSPAAAAAAAPGFRRADSSRSAIMKAKKRNRAKRKNGAPDAWQDTEGEEAEQTRVAKTPAYTSERGGHSRASERSSTRATTGNLDPLPVAQRLLLKAASGHSGISGQNWVSEGSVLMCYERGSPQGSEDAGREGALHPIVSETNLGYSQAGIVSLDDGEEPMSVVPSQTRVHLNVPADRQEPELDELDDLGVGSRLPTIKSEVINSSEGIARSQSNLSSSRSWRRRVGCLCCTSGSEEMSCVRATCRSVIRHSYCDVVSSALILVNSLTMGLQTDYMARHLREQTPSAFRRIDMVFAVAFTLELSLRLVAYGCSFFTRPGWRWNVLDFLVVAMQLVEMALVSVQLDGDNLSSLSMLRTMRILRLLRSVRIVRLLRYVDDLRTVLVSVLSAFKPLCSTLVLIGLIIYIAGIYFTELVTLYRLENAAAEADFGNLCDSLGITMLRLFQTVTGGMEWTDFSAPLMEHISPLMGVVFAAYITFMTLAILNIVTGVFVDAATQRSRKEKDVFMINNLRELFESLDLNANGVISWGEFKHHLKDDRLITFFKDIDLDVSEAQGLFMLLDRNDSGSICMDEFLSGCLNLRGPARALDMQLLMREIFYRRQEEEERMLTEATDGSEVETKTSRSSGQFAAAATEAANAVRNRHAVPAPARGAPQ